MFDSLRQLVSGGVWAYPAEGAVVALDGFVPIVPGETVVISAAVLAASGDLVVWLVLLAAIIGAFVGDNISVRSWPRATSRFRAAWRGDAEPPSA